MAQQTHSRRSALGILATGPVAMLPALAVMSCGTKADAGTIGELPALIAKYHRAEARCTRFDERVESPACKQFAEAVGAIPHHRTVHGFANINGDVTHLDTANPASVAVARKALAGEIYETSKPTDGGAYWDTVRELVRADDARNEQMGRLRIDFRIDEYDSHSEKLASYAWEAKWAAINYPVNSLAELCLKLDFIEEEGAFADEDAGLAVAADVRRLAGITI
ncbi:hypothetical protein [Rhizorhabdus sp.]|jgi:hypothetical protein|uniref:hypothetical protein n=1 Tax=Rhizorhabdus sp. TaxID=1968843 RepID=UPI0019CE449A|nr:hypothetical protein [Rhizorhabdus sp.]MBD3761478.1 hypothetical protein [Rhizorhabdus sp.]